MGRLLHLLPGLLFYIVVSQIVNSNHAPNYIRTRILDVIYQSAALNIMLLNLARSFSRLPVKRNDRSAVVVLSLGSVVDASVSRWSVVLDAWDDMHCECSEFMAG
ncbi:hypothetical protein F5Y03DRAFT_360269 [Xylaria venustula]|nr:hypothetical protein F5Y03DRAFT_360269 [Xylaria venustula]